MNETQSEYPHPAKGRRAFIKFVGRKSAGAILTHAIPQSSNSPPSETTQPPDISFQPKSTLSDQIKMIQDNIKMNITPPEEGKLLIEYLNKVEDRKKEWMKAAWKHKLQYGVRNKSLEQIQNDLDTYAPVYFAAEEKYHIPAALLWIIHTNETLNSIAVKGFPPENNGVGGCMQINRSDFHRLKLEKAITGYEFLRVHPSLRFKGNKIDKKSFSAYNDASEILAAAMYIDIFCDKKNNRFIKDDDDRETRTVKSQIIYVGGGNEHNSTYVERKVRYYGVMEGLREEKLIPNNFLNQNQGLAYSFPQY